MVGTKITSSVTSVTSLANLGVGDYTLMLSSNGCDNPGGGFTIYAATSGMNATLTPVSAATCTGTYGVLGVATTGSPTHYRLNGGAWTLVPSANFEISVPSGDHKIELSNGTCISEPATRVIDNASG
jgi:hypothetical protein